MTCDLLQLPELVHRRVLSYLTFRDICRLRLTSRKFQELLLFHLNGLNLTHLRVEITQGTSDTFESAMEIASNLNLAIQELRINCDNPQFYDDPTSVDFAVNYAQHIRKLYLKHYFAESATELQFLNHLNQVTEFEIGTINAQNFRPKLKKKEKPFRNEVIDFPNFFDNLKVLNFGVIRISKEMAHRMELGPWYPIINACPKLNHVRYPRVLVPRGDLLHGDVGEGDGEFPVDRGVIQFKSLENYINEQRIKYPEPQNWIKSIDFKNAGADAREGSDFIMFIQFVTNNNMDIKLFNVGAEFLENLPSGLGDYYERFNCIKSLVNYNYRISFLPLDNLEAISIKYLASCLTEHWEESTSAWPMLKSVSVNVDVTPDEMEDEEEGDMGTGIMRMMDFLFVSGGSGRDESLTEATISFDPILSNFDYQFPSYVIDTRRIGNGICNLRKLTLVRWNLVNKSYLPLWQELVQLEELWIEDCPTLGNVGFIGKDEQNPVFLGLTKLKKLTLVLDDMPKITDRAFKDVFRHMRLKEFTLRSAKPLKSNITRTGISWLLKGQFSKTIEKFPFKTWSSVHISSEEMVKLKAQFKSLLF